MLTLFGIVVSSLGRVGKIDIITFSESVQYVFPYLLGALAPMAGTADMTHRQEYAAFLDGGEDPRSQVDRDHQKLLGVLLQFVFRRPG